MKKTFALLLCAVMMLGLLALPVVLEETGVWLAVPFAEVLSCLVSALCLFRGRRRYHYA